MTTIWTIGHSTYGVDEFLAELRAHDIAWVADVRSFPGSRRSPQYGSKTMHAWLEVAGVGYAHLPALGGRRRDGGVDPSVNGGWSNASFRYYADFMSTPEFARGVAALEALAREARVAYMCSEALPWRCHRSLLSDALVARGWKVVHILGTGPTRDHVLGGWGAAPRVQGAQVTYPAAASADAKRTP